MLYQERPWILFDCDGLIFDSESAAFEAWSSVYKDYGFELQLKDWILCVGSGPGNAGFNPAEGLRKLVSNKDKSLLPSKPNAFLDIKEKRKVAICSQMPLLPGVEELLKKIKLDKKNAGVVSSSPVDWVKPHLDRLGISGYFEFVVTRSDLKPGQKSKPAPDFYLLGVDAASCYPSQALVLEDSARGVEAAKEAGAACIAVPNPITKISRFDHADCQLNSLTELL